MTDHKPDSNPCFEVVVHLKGEDQSYRKKFLSYSEACISQEDPIIAELISEAKKECKFEIEEVKVKASF